MCRVASTTFRTSYTISSSIRAGYHTNVLPSCQLFKLHPYINRGMSSHVRSSLSHEERTAAEPRENELHEVVLHQIHHVLPNVRLIRLRPRNNQQPIKVCLHLFKQAYSRQFYFEINSTMV